MPIPEPCHPYDPLDDPNDPHPWAPIPPPDDYRNDPNTPEYVDDFWDAVEEFFEDLWEDIKELVNDLLDKDGRSG